LATKREESLCVREQFFHDQNKNRLFNHM